MLKLKMYQRAHKEWFFQREFDFKPPNLVQPGTKWFLYPVGFYKRLNLE